MKNFTSRFCILLMILFLYLPILYILIFSFNNHGNVIGFDKFNFGFKYYKLLFQNHEIWKAFITSIMVAIITTVISTIIGTLAAISFSRCGEIMRKYISLSVKIPLINADIVTACGLFLIFLLLGWHTGFLTMCAAHISFAVPYVFLAVMSQVKSIKPNVIEAGLDLGANELQITYKIILKIILGGIIAGAAFAFAASFDDFVISYFTGGTTQNISIYLYTIKRYTPLINAFAVIFFLLIIGTLLIFKIFTHFRFRRINFAKKLKKLQHEKAKKEQAALDEKIKKLEIKLKNYHKPNSQKKHFWRRVVTCCAAIIVALSGLIFYFSYLIPDLTISVFTGYVDDEKIHDFEQKHHVNIKLVYFNSNEEIYTKIFSTNIDLYMMSDYMIGNLANYGHLSPINWDLIGKMWGITANNAKNKINPSIQNLLKNYMLKNGYSLLDFMLPMFLGTLDIYYNKSNYPNYKSDNPHYNTWKGVFDAAHKGKRVLLPNDPRNLFLIALMSVKDENGTWCGMNNSSNYCLNKAADKLKSIVHLPNVQLVSDDDFSNVFAENKFDVAVGNGGDFLYAMSMNENLHVDKISISSANTFSASGRNVWVDGFAVNSNLSGKRLTLAYEFMAFYFGYPDDKESASYKLAISQYFTPANELAYEDAQRYFSNNIKNPSVLNEFLNIFQYKPNPHDEVFRYFNNYDYFILKFNEVIATKN